jgi:hypothetical protein
MARKKEPLSENSTCPQHVTPFKESNAAEAATKMEGEPPGEPWVCDPAGASPSNKTVARRDEINRYWNIESSLVVQTVFRPGRQLAVDRAQINHHHCAR